jgi:hypothetical protein
VQLLVKGLIYGVEAEQPLLLPIVQSALQPSPSTHMAGSAKHVAQLGVVHTTASQVKLLAFRVVPAGHALQSRVLPE